MTNNETHKIDYYKNGNIQCEKYYFNGKLHNENRPAAIYYYENGNKYCEEYYINGKFVMTDKEVEKYINSKNPIKTENINKLRSI